MPLLPNLASPLTVCLLLTAMPAGAMNPASAGKPEKAANESTLSEPQPSSAKETPPLQAPSVTAAAAAATPAQAKAEASPEARFDVLEFRIEGNSVLSALAIETAVYPFLGEQREVKDMEAARKALEKAYHDGGYLTVFVDLPEQEVTGGLVRLKVTEAKVERQRVSGAKYFSLGRIKSQTSQLAEGNVPYFPELQKELASVNRSADRKVTPALRAGRSPGTVEVDLKVQDRSPMHGRAELNDRYSLNTSHSRLALDLRYNNLWQRQHGLNLSFQVAPEETKDSQVFAGTYLVPLTSGNFLAAYMVHNESDVAAIGAVNTIGQGDILGLRYILPLRGRPGYFHNLTLGVDYKNFNQTVNLLGGGGIDLPISYLPFTVAYDATLPAGSRGQTKFNLSANFSVRGLGNDAKEFSDKASDPNWSNLKVEVKNSMKFADDWLFSTRLGGQLASRHLISNEQYAIGGVDSVRGYPESAALGDNGFSSSLELQMPGWNGLHPYLFMDAATVRVREASAGTIDRYDLLSTGAGVRISGWGGFSGALDWAYPYKTVGNVVDGDSRLHFRLSYEW